MDAEGTIEENGTRIYIVRKWYQSLPPTETGMGKSSKFLQALIDNSEWHQNENKRFGNFEPRLSFATGEGKDQYGTPIVHKYGSVSIEMDNWTSTVRPEIQRVRELRDIIEEQTGLFHDSALVQYYRNGLDYNSEHFDSGLRDSQSRRWPVYPTKTVYCLTLGARRKFIFRRNSDEEKFDYWLEDGDILVMEGKCQEQFTHGLPKSTAKKTSRDAPGTAVGPRISITWRLLGEWKFDV